MEVLSKSVFIAPIPCRAVVIIRRLQDALPEGDGLQPYDGKSIQLAY
jgi:hypothetical protein